MVKSIDQGEKVGAVFFDLKKAFDVVDHEILLKSYYAIILITHQSIGFALFFRIDNTA